MKKSFSQIREACKEAKEREQHPPLITGDCNYSDIDLDNKFAKAPEKERESSRYFIQEGFAEVSCNVEVRLEAVSPPSGCCSTPTALHGEQDIPWYGTCLGDVPTVIISGTLATEMASGTN